MKRLAGLLLVLSLPCLAAPALATTQAPELILLDGTLHVLLSHPLEPYFHGGKRKPEALRPHSTACRRGYQGTWEIKDGRLRLIGLAKCAAGEEIPLGRVFPGSSGPIEASWYSGTLCVPQGRIVGVSRRRGFSEAVHERYRYIEIKAGRVVREEVLGEGAG